MDLEQRLDETTAYLDEQMDTEPEIALVLGSGLGDLADEIDGDSIPYSDIPAFPETQVEGHDGRLVYGQLEGKQVAALKGRVHYYETGDMDPVVYPVRSLYQAGADQLLVTNAGGCLNTEWEPGDLMLIEDHINNMGDNPLIGPNPDSLGDRFPDMTEAYSPSMRQHARDAADELDIDLREGIYIANTGPMYETPAEVRALQQQGGDAVGASVVPEVIAANHMDMEAAGITCLTNMGAGLADEPLSHDEVIETTEEANEYFHSLVRETVKRL